MPHSHCHSLRSFHNAPPLSAIIHGANPVSFEDGFCLPSSFHSRTWLLNNFQETCNETTSCQMTNCEQDLLTEESCAQSTCLPGVVQTTYSNSKPCERSAPQSESSSSGLACVSQLCQSGSIQQMGSVGPSRQPASLEGKCCLPKTSESKSCQTLECLSNQCQPQNPESSSCRPLVSVAPEPQLLESSSSTSEPTCCVTGGFPLPSK
ncbi:keratin-associated protein 27-1 [Saimiri boliviensis]|uniref:keratin-associated protein 27-1 n=1 Tax=Saimiri boliviensis TaxID=27679 RepID=UPI00027F89CC|nr:keratin-associated protein 27-1 [Saimiri boliviensis boliviensis]